MRKYKKSLKRSTRQHAIKVINPFNTPENKQKKTVTFSDYRLFRDPAGARTRDPNIKSVVLYLLSYRINARQNGLPSILVVQMYI